MLPNIQSPNLSKFSTIHHAFMTRQGGVSTGLFSSLNAAMEKQDTPDNVKENRRRIAEFFGGSPEQLITLSQVHSNIVIHVEQAWEHKDRPVGDALVTRCKDLIISIITADCVPVLLADPDAGVIGAAHAGWKGATNQIIQNTVKSMIDLGATPEKIQAAIGPCIWQNSYEVDHEFYNNLPNDSGFFKLSANPNHWMFDLPGYVESQLRLSGIDRITPSPADTYANEDQFFSNRRRTHRNEESFGCMLSGIKLKSK